MFASSVRVSIGEEFGLPYGTAVTGKLIGALKSLGAKKVLMFLSALILLLLKKRMSCWKE